MAAAAPNDYSQPTECKCWLAKKSGGPLEAGTITRRAMHPTDVVINIKYAGICHSDIHQVREEWGPAIFPMVPGHEIAGEVVAVGAEVQGFKVGDTVGVGCMVDSCRECKQCKAGFEQYCANRSVATYNGRAQFKHCAEYNDEGGAPTYGGYSQFVLVYHKFVVHIPKNIDLAAAAPLLCAGITTYSPLRHFGLQKDHKFAVVGLGGLGHMGVKFGVAMGAHVTVISRGKGKKDDAINKLGAHAFLDSTDADAMKAAQGSFDFILDTVAADHDIEAEIALLGIDGKLVIVGASPSPMKIGAFSLLMGRRTVAGSAIGGIAETQEMLDFCGKHNIVCDIEKIVPSQINEAYERAIKSDVKYRFVIDNSQL